MIQKHVFQLYFLKQVAAKKTESTQIFVFVEKEWNFVFVWMIKIDLNKEFDKELVFVGLSCEEKKKVNLRN
jgi:hypothetical protein